MALKQQVSLNISQKLSQKLVMTQTLQQAIKLLQMSRLELQESIQQELMENPVLEDVSESVDDHGPDVPQKKDEDPRDSGEESFDQKLDQIDMESYFQDYLGDYQPRQEREYVDTSDLPSFENMVTRQETLHEHLERQLGMLPINEAAFEIGLEIIGNINDAGRLIMELEDILDRCPNDPRRDN